MTKSIIITYKNGSVINIDVLETFYATKYKNTSEKKLHKVFMKEYEKFVSALNKSQNVINVGKYLKFSSATISCENVLGVDIKVIEENSNLSQANVTVPGIHDKTYLDISETSLDTILKKLETTNLLENLDTFIKKVNAMMAKNNVEVTIKAGVKKKPSATAAKKTAAIKEEIIEVKDETAAIVTADSVEQVNREIIETAAQQE